MSQFQEEQFNKVANEKASAKGEFKMLALLFVMFAALFIDSLQVEGIFQGRSSGPGGIPQIVCFLMLILVGVQTASLYKQGYKEGTFSELIHYLFDKDVVILLVMVVFYGALVETLHFIPTTILFLATTMYLLERTNLIKKILISVSTVAVLVLIFSTIFQVVLP